MEIIRDRFGKAGDVSVIEFTIGPAEAGKKVQRYVRQLLPGVPLSGIHKMIRTGRVKQNGKRAKAESVLASGDVIRIYMAEEDYEQVSKPEKKFGGVSRDVDVVYEDSEMIVVNKPIGLLTHGAAGEHKDTLVNRVLAVLHDQGQLFSQQFTPAPVHRLDRNTSGLVLFGKTHEATRRLSEQFQTHVIRKWYIALVKGLTPADGIIDAPLARAEGRNQTFVSKHGVKAVTKYVTLGASRNTSLVRVELVSGRTHQIRAHFAHIGHPLWADVKYGGRRTGVDEHQWLHAQTLWFPNGQRISAPLPAEYRNVLQFLGYQSKDVEQWLNAPMS